MSAKIYGLFIPGDKECIEVIRQIRWSRGYVCPYCNSRDVILKGKERNKPYIQRYRCNSCRRHFNDLTGTIFAKKQMSLGEMFYIIKNLKNSSIKQISEELERDYRTVYYFAEEVMELSEKDNILKKLLEM
ncbi:IS1/IS1595 family N-terminal zinc-binding domain-containing protein [Methanotorris igneus]|uniref:IS1/IS1595 family N-terminal zinc-binding domain-containing protein n=1 Tax=Methanotorris igneus TaxID=2189 RepID=UPI00064E89F1|nr:transposase [Methanotorris igneus]